MRKLPHTWATESLQSGPLVDSVGALGEKSYKRGSVYVGSVQYSISRQ